MPNSANLDSQPANQILDAKPSPEKCKELCLNILEKVRILVENGEVTELTIYGSSDTRTGYMSSKCMMNKSLRDILVTELNAFYIELLSHIGG